MRLSAILLLVWLSAPALAIDASDPDAKLALDPNVEHFELENGIDVYLRQNHEPENRAELRLVVDAGSILEDEDQRGLAHFLEHMAFNGTEHFEKQELIDYLESIGMRFGPDINAYTSFDETVYMLEIPTDDVGIMQQAILILEDWAHGITIDPEEVDKERGVVIEEWRQGRGAQQRIRDEQLPVLLKGSRYPERLPIGKKDVLESVPAAAIERYYGDWYRPDLMAVIAVGDFDLDWMREEIRKHFDRIDAPADPKERVVYGIDVVEPLLASVVTDPEASLARVEVQSKLEFQPRETVADYRRFIEQLLFTQMLNVRYGELVQRPNPPFIGASASQGRLMRNGAEFSLGATVDADGVEGGMRALLREARRVELHGFTQGELDRAKARVLRSLQAEYEERENTNSAVFASRYVRHFLTDSPSVGIEAALGLAESFFPQIQLDDVQRHREGFLAADNHVLLASGPESAKSTFPAEEALIAAMREVSQESVEPYVDDVGEAALLSKAPTPGSIVAEKHHATVDVTEWKLSNGARVLLKPTDNKEDEVLVRAVSAGGTSLVEDDDYDTASLISFFAEAGGLGGMDAISLDKFLAGKRVSLGGGIGELDESLQGAYSPQDEELFFQLLHARFTELRHDQQAFEALRQRYVAYLENRSLDPNSAFSDSLGATLSQHHFRRRPLTVERLGSVDYEAGMEFFEERYANAGDFLFVFVGNFTLESIRPRIETYVASLPGSDTEEEWIDRGIRPPGGVVQKAVYAGQEPKSSTAVIYHGDFDWERQERYEIHSLARALQIRLREVLREDLGGTYGVGVSASPQRDPYAHYRLIIQFGSDPDRVDELLTSMRGVLQAMREEGPTDEIVQKVQEAQRRDFEDGQQENSWWLSQILFRASHDSPLAETLDYLPLVDALTADDLQDAAERYLDEERLVQMTLYPDEGATNQR